jgi:hypothetical protein
VAQRRRRPPFDLAKDHARILRLIPKDIPRQSPGPDLILTVDRVTKEYTEYREYTPGTMVVAPSDVLNRCIGDVVPTVAETFNQAIWAAQRGRQAVDIEYVLGRHHRQAHVVVNGDRVALNITAVCAPRALMVGGGGGGKSVDGP